MAGLPVDLSLSCCTVVVEAEIYESLFNDFAAETIENPAGVFCKTANAHQFCG